MTAGDARPQPGAKYLLLATTVFLSLGGMLMIFSASAVMDFIDSGNSYDHLIHQAVFLALGFAGMVVCSRLSGGLIRKAGWWILLGSDAALVLVLVSGAGKWGAVRWIDLGFTTLQPSEFAKLGCVLVVAGIMADRVRHPGDPWRNDLIKILLAVGIPFGLVMLQPDMGTAMSIAVAVFVVMVLGGLPKRMIAAAIAVAGLSIPALIFAKGYRATRFLSFLDPTSDPQGAGYQILQARIAFGSGGLFGLGLGMSRQKIGYLPAAHTDFIFAIIGEELGLLGSLAVVIAFGLFCYAGIKLTLAVKDPFARLVSGGLTAMIVTQAIINMSSVTGLMPVTGVPLPLVSYGGSSLIFTLGCIGLILAASSGRRSAKAASRSRVS
jgi:cell division protein FtsW